MSKSKAGLLFHNKWVKRLTGILLIWLGIHLAYITYDGMADNVTRSDIAIVLGNKANADGSLAPWTETRVARALDLYRQGKVKYIFVSGGITRETGYPEGKAMKAYLLAHQVPDSAVFADDRGINTYSTAVNFLAFNQPGKFSSAVVVSQFYHITRSKYILRKMGFRGRIESASAQTYFLKDIIGALREVPAFYKYLLYY